MRFGAETSLQSVLGSIGGWIADRIADLAFAVLHCQRQAAAANVARVLAVEPHSPVVHKVVRQAFRSSVRNIFALVAIRLFPPEWHPPVVIEFADEQGGVVRKPAIIISAHLGPFDVVGALLGAQGNRISALAAPMRPRWLDTLVRALRSAPGVTLLAPTRQGLRQAIAAITSQQNVVFFVDRNVLGSGRTIKFFGVPTRLPDGPVRLARRLGCSLVPIFSYRMGHRYVVRVERPITVPRSDNAEHDVQRALETVVQVLEQAIQRAPDQWLVFSPVWPGERGRGRVRRVDFGPAEGYSAQRS